MEVFDLDVCDFFECKITQYQNEDEYSKDIFDPEKILFLDILPRTLDLNLVKVPLCRRTENGLEKGMIGRIGKYPYDEHNQYLYPPSQFTSSEQYQWLASKRRELAKNNMKLVIDYWKLDKSSFQSVYRDKLWWKENEPKVRQCWMSIQNKRNNMNDSSSDEEIELSKNNRNKKKKPKKKRATLKDRRNEEKFQSKLISEIPILSTSDDDIDETNNDRKLSIDDMGKKYNFAGNSNNKNDQNDNNESENNYDCDDPKDEDYDPKDDENTINYFN